MRAGERWTLRAYAVKQYAYLQSTVRQYKRFISVKYDTLFDFYSVVIGNKFELLTFPR